MRHRRPTGRAGWPLHELVGDAFEVEIVPLLDLAPSFLRRTAGRSKGSGVLGFMTLWRGVPAGEIEEGHAAPLPFARRMVWRLVSYCRASADTEAPASTTA